MGTALKLEFFKMKRSRTLLPSFGLLSFGILWLFVALQREVQIGSGEIKNVYHIFLNMGTINNLIFPLIIALFASRICDLEHKGRMLNLLVTSNQRKEQLFLTKIVISFVIFLGLFLFENLFIFFFSYTHKIPFETQTYLLFGVGSIVAGLFLCVIHVFLSMYFRKQIIGVGLALAGSFISLTTSGRLPDFINFLIPWQYFSLLNPVTLKAINGTAHAIQKENWGVNLTISLFVLFCISVLLFHQIKKEGRD